MKDELIHKGELVNGHFKLNFDKSTETISLESESGDMIYMYNLRDIDDVSDLLWQAKYWFNAFKKVEVEI